MPRLIINADDFGLTRGINHAIAELHDAGALTSATLMAAGPAFDHAVALAHQRPTLGIGCHIVLTDGDPISSPRTIPSLMALNGRTLRGSLIGFLAALLSNQIDPTDIEREATSQIQRLQSSGLTVTHLDTHKHTHIFPPVARALFRAAARTGVHAIRNPFEQPWSFRLATGDPARTSQVRLLNTMKRRFLNQPALRSGQIRTTDGTIGVSATGSLDQPTLQNLLNALPEGTWELVCHPGYNDADLKALPTRLRETRNTERQALLALLSQKAREQTQTSPHPPHPELIHYADLVTAALNTYNVEPGT